MTNARIKEMETVITENFDELKNKIFNAHALADTLDNALYFADQRDDKNIVQSASKVAEMLAEVLNILSGSLEEAEQKIMEAVETEEVTQERINKDLNVG